MWRIKKCSTGSQLETSNSFMVEKIYNFEGCTEWISKLIYEPLQNRAYAIADTTVTILNVKKRRVECVLSDLHETPITACIWYPADKFYITSCMSGVVRCWFVKEKVHHVGRGVSLDVASPPQQVAVSLHAFNAHTRAVSGLYLHPRPGLLITAGMDACVKVFDLEAFTQIQSIQTAEGITHFNLGEYSANPVCLFAHLSGELVMWKIESCCHEFATCTSDIAKLSAFENMNEFYSLHASQICFNESETLGNNIGLDRLNNHHNQSGTVVDPNPALVAQHKVTKAASTLSIRSTDMKSTALPQYITDLDKTVHEKLPRIMSRNASEMLEDDLFNETFQRSNCMIAFAGHDLQILSVSGAVMSRCTADSLIDGVTHYTFSMFQQLLFCVLESGALRVFCTRSPICILLREIYIGALSGDKVTALALVEGMSLGALRSSTTSKDMRGEPSPLNVNEAILIGTADGVLLCVDTFQECALVSTQQISKGRVEDLKYRPLRNELIVIAKSSISSVLSTVKVFKVPDMILTHSFRPDNAFSCLDISSLESFVIIGCNQGSHQLFKLLDAVEQNNAVESVKRYHVEFVDDDSTYGRFVEILHEDSDHTKTVTGISFCDKLNAYATSAMDATIKFWDFKKRCLKTILLDVPSRDVLFNWPLGSLVVTQREKLQTISYDSWRLVPSGDKEEEEEDMEDMEGGADEKDGCEKEPQSSPPHTAHSRHTDHSSKPHTGVTFLTDHDRDELAEMAFLEATLQANGNLEDYWKTHSSVGFDHRKANSTRRARGTTKRKKGTSSSGIKFDVRNPQVPIPPRRTKSNYFKRQSQKTLEAQLAPPSPPSGGGGKEMGAELTDESENSDEDDFEHFLKLEGSEVEASALEDMVGRKESRGAGAGKSLLLKTQSFARKISQNVVAKRNSSMMSNHVSLPPGRNAIAAGESLDFFQTVQNAKSRPTAAVNNSLAGNTALSLFMEKQQATGSAGPIPDEIELFVKPNGPKGKNAFQRVRPKLLLMTGGGGKTDSASKQSHTGGQG